MRATRCDGDTGQAGNRDNPPNVLRRHSLESRMGPGSRTPSWPAVPRRLHQQAEQKTAPDQAAKSSIPLAMREPSTEDVRRQLEAVAVRPSRSLRKFWPVLRNRRLTDFSVQSERMLLRQRTGGMRLIDTGPGPPRYSRRRSCHCYRTTRNRADDTVSHASNSDAARLSYQRRRKSGTSVNGGLKPGQRGGVKPGRWCRARRHGKGPDRGPFHVAVNF